MMPDIAGERKRLAEQGLNIATRESWSARQAYTSARRVDSPARGFFLHIAVIKCPARTVESERAAMRTIEAIGQDRFGIGCSYNAAPCQSGRLYELQPLTRRGAHTVNNKGVPRYGAKDRSLNYEYRALALPQNIGDEVTDAQIDSAARWAAAQIRAGLAVKGARWDLHRTVAWKDCPGDLGARRLDQLNRLTAHYEANGLGRASATVKEDDMYDLTDRDKLFKTNAAVGRLEVAVANLAAAVASGRDEPSRIVQVVGEDEWWLISEAGRSHVSTRAAGDLLVFSKLAVWDFANSRPIQVPAAESDKVHGVARIDDVPEDDDAPVGPPAES